MSTDLNDPGIRFDSRVPVPVIEASTEPGVTERVSEGFNRLESGLKPESMVSPNATKETRSMAYGHAQTAAFTRPTHRQSSWSK
ncbi:MAG: hypothetical protein P8P91_08920 [Pseudomonadales bacterium]|nr:hypothetical protein [Pseudomonadales bacterium]